MTIHPELKREGCCADTRKPCSYHEGYADGWDANERRIQENLLKAFKTEAGGQP